MRKLAGIASALALLAVFGLVGNMDYQDAKAEESRYAAMVCAGHWPDYDNRKPDCSGVAE